MKGIALIFLLLAALAIIGPVDACFRKNAPPNKPLSELAEKETGAAIPRCLKDKYHLDYMCPEECRKLNFTTGICFWGLEHEGDGKGKKTYLCGCFDICGRKSGGKEYDCSITEKGGNAWETLKKLWSDIKKTLKADVVDETHDDVNRYRRRRATKKRRTRSGTIKIRGFQWHNVTFTSP